MKRPLTILFLATLVTNTVVVNAQNNPSDLTKVLTQSNTRATATISTSAVTVQPSTNTSTTPRLEDLFKKQAQQPTAQPSPASSQVAPKTEPAPVAPKPEPIPTTNPITTSSNTTPTTSDEYNPNAGLLAQLMPTQGTEKIHVPVNELEQQLKNLEPTGQFVERVLRIPQGNQGESKFIKFLVPVFREKNQPAP